MKKALFAALALSLPLAAQAVVPGITLKVGAYQWWQDWDGDARSGSGATKLDINRDLGIDDDSGATFYVAFDHFVPVLPNIKLQRSSVDISGRSTLQREITFAGETYSNGAEVTSSFDLSHTDGTLYWRILDNIVGLHVGLTARHFDGDLKISGDGNSGRIKLNTTLPLFYGAAHVKLPLTGLYANAEVNAISVRSSSATDYRLGVGWGTGPFNVEGGYRNFELDYDGNRERANITVDGFYLGARLEF